MPEHTDESSRSSVRSEVSVRTRTLNRLEPVLRDLDSFDRGLRSRALEQLAAEIASGAIAVPEDKPWVNLHAHTFFSYSSENYSPSRLTWEALLRGLLAVGSTDFDVLDATDEMLAAGDALAIRTTVSLESRVFVEAYADREINSPGEPGILYTMGAGFVRHPAPGSPAARFIQSLAAQSRARNIAMIARINPLLSPVEIDYDADVVPLTPAGNATERHICAAYDNKSRAVFPDRESLAVFWADVLGKAPDEMEKLLADCGTFHNAMRAKLMKRGGVGYVQPDGGAFPSILDFNRATLACGAVPCHAWLDGTSKGEEDPGKLLDDAIGWGARAVNIVPERNWNIADPAVKEKKVGCMAAFVKAARERDLPILAGTEMNSPGQKFVDPFDAPELKPFADDFIAAAYWLYGHTVLARAADIGLASEWAERHFAKDRKAANRFYAEVGKIARPGAGAAAVMKSIRSDMTPDQVLALFQGKAPL